MSNDLVRFTADAEQTAIIAVTPEQLADATATRVSSGFHVLTLVGTDERTAGGAFGLWVTLLDPAGRIVHLRSALDPACPCYPSVTRRVPAVHWDEREMADLLGFRAMGHPDPRRLVLREDWPQGLYPLRKDFDASLLPPPGRHDEYPFIPIGGENVGHVPVGPIHAGVIEPGHFRFAAVGETVLHLEARLFYTHRGIEKLVEGRTPDEALPLVERLCGVCTFSHALAFCEAVESCSGARVPERALWARALCLELERLYNHVGDAGNICAGTGFAVGAMRGAWLKEKVQRLIERLVGHRFLRDVCAVGGLRRDLPASGLADLADALTALRRETRDVGTLLLETDSFVDRIRGTGVLSAEVVRELGGIGVAARASGVDGDLRRDRPTGWYRHVVPHRILQQSGDVEARLRQRLAEANDSWDLLRQLLDAEPAGPVREEVTGLRAGVGVGAVESPRGADVHWLLLDDEGRVQRLRVRSASFANWPLVAAAVPGNLLPDFPLINKSFELCYACLDR